MNFNENYWAKNKNGLQIQHKIASKYILPNDNVLDIGCGNGTFLEYINCKNKVGIDISKNALKKAFKKSIEVRKINVETDKLPYLDDEFDKVTMLDFLEHFLEPTKILRKCSMKGKKIIICVPNMAFIKDRLYCLFGKVPPELKPKKGHCYYFTEDTLSMVICEAGLKVLERDYYYPKNIKLGKPSLFSTMFVYICEKVE